MTRQTHRLDQGGLIDRTRPLGFSFDGQTYGGYAGDTLASALVANGVRLVGRSFKYHRPRGILTAGSEEPNALVELRSGARREPNTKATTIELYDGLLAQSQNRWPSLAFDVMAVNSFLSPLFVAGFYYKTFMWPARLWEALYEPVIRRAAGLGRAAAVADPDHYEKATAFCDVLVIGSGPAGLMAARTAARAGARVILCEEDFRLGGRLLSERFEIDGRPGALWVDEVEKELSSLSEVRIMRRTAVFGAYDTGTYGALEKVEDHHPVPSPFRPRQRLWKIVARRVVLAGGATEQPMTFAGNDRPGLMLASAVRTYVSRFGATPGRRVAVFTANDDGWKTVSDLAAAGIAVEAVIDARPDVRSDLVSAAQRAGARVYAGSSVLATHGAKGLQAIDIASARGRIRVDVDCLAVAGGWSPNLGLASHHGARPVWSEKIAAFVPGDMPPGMTAAGAVAGDFALSSALATGLAAGAKAAEDAGFTAAPEKPPRASDDSTDATPFWHLMTPGGKAFVDFQHDVTVSDIELAHREGFRSVEHLKRYTTLGMATDQGKLSNFAGHVALARISGSAVQDVGSIRPRPPHVPVAIGAFAGHHRAKDFRPMRLPPSHDWAAENGASFVESGAWMRAQWYARPGEEDWLTSVTREVRSVRLSVGVCDVSTLGKIDIQGADVGALLDLVYTNTFSTLPVGKARYGLMLRDDGFVMDDGTTARLAADHYVMTTTTANAGPVMQHLEFCRQVLWPALDVQLASVSDHWAQFSIAGPKSREVVARLVGPFDVSNAAFPYLGAASVVIDGIPGRLFRLSFSGEPAYEVAVPAQHGDRIIRAIMDAGRDFGIVPYGTEALGVMRIEKGHAGGGELNGQTTANDLGLGKMLSTKKDFIGRQMANRPGLLDPARPALVGIKPVDPAARISGGAHVLPLGAPMTIEHDEGYVTSVAFSPSLGQWIGLGFVKHGPQRIGERLRAVDPVRGRDTEVELCSPVFIDPEGQRLRV